MDDRVVEQTTLRGFVMFPIGLRFLSREPGADAVPSVLVSTVQLDDAHKEDPLGMVEPETGFETMVFPDGCRFFSLHTVHYKTRRSARQGHAKIVAALLDGSLPLTVRLGYYSLHSVEAAAA